MTLTLFQAACARQPFKISWSARWHSLGMLDSVSLDLPGFLSLRSTPRARSRSYTRAYPEGWYQFEHARVGLRVRRRRCSRVTAATCGCRVTAIDLTPQLIEVARELTRRCGMADRIEFRQADALDLPFAEGTFDHVWCHNVTMNIQDKRRLASEVARVLKPGGRFSCSENGQGPGGPLIFPLALGYRHIGQPSSLRQRRCAKALQEGGLRIIEEIDLSARWLALLKEIRVRAEPAPQRSTRIT